MCLKIFFHFHFTFNFVCITFEVLKFKIFICHIRQCLCFLLLVLWVERLPCEIRKMFNYISSHFKVILFLTFNFLNHKNVLVNFQVNYDLVYSSSCHYSFFWKLSTFVLLIRISAEMNNWKKWNWSYFYWLLLLTALVKVLVEEFLLWHSVLRIQLQWLGFLWRHGFIPCPGAVG